MNIKNGVNYRVTEYIRENNLEPEAMAKAKKYTLEDIEDSIENGTILNVWVQKSTEDNSLIVDIGENIVGIIKREDTILPKNNMEITKQGIVHLVGKTIKVIAIGYEEDINGNKVVKLSRRKVQERFRDEILEKSGPGLILNGCVTGSEKYGIFIDIGCGLYGLIKTRLLSVNKISEVETKVIFKKRAIIPVVILDIEDGQIILSYREMLGTWQENIDRYEIKPEIALVGRVQKLKSFGVFIQITPNLSGLADYKEGLELEEGDLVTVLVTNVIRDKMKVKLSLLGKSDAPYDKNYTNTILEGLHIDKETQRMSNWQFSDVKEKVIGTIFKERFSSRLGER